MRVEKRPLSEVPPDAIIISSREAYDHYINRIFSWPNRADVWPFTIGTPIVTAGFVYITNYLFTYYFRGRFKIRDHARVMSYVMCSGVPTITSPIIHFEFIVKDIILGDPCVYCIYLKAVLTQLIFSLGYGLIVSPAFSTMVALSKFTADLPGITTHEDRMEMLKIYQRYVKRIAFKIGIIAFLNSASIVYLVYKECSCINEFILKLEKNEKEVSEFTKKFQEDNQRLESQFVYLVVAT